MNRASKAFTLIELLIVVAIIAILAAIAIPNMLDAQVRAKVGRAQADERSITIALESYMTDNGRLPPWSAFSSNINNFPRGLRVLTTPIAYSGSAIDIYIDPFAKWNSVTLNFSEVWYESIYGNMQGSRNNTGTSAIRDAYIVESVGPSRTDDIHTGFWGNDRFQPTGETVYFVPYDPSNGTVSRGDVYRVGGRVPKWFIERGWPLVNPAK